MSWTREEADLLKKLYDEGHSLRHISSELGKTIDAVKSRIYRSGIGRGHCRGMRDILSDQRKAFLKRRSAFEARTGYDRQVGEGPYGILFMGDPHMDDDGCDLDRIDRDFALVHDTPRLFAACLGDLTNNWIGKLARLHSDQHVTDAEAEELVEWFLSSAQWLFVVLGNHDRWTPLAARICREYGVTFVPHGGKFRVSSGKHSIKIDARHSHRGQSMYNPAHAQVLRSFRGTDCDIVIGGHHHKSGYTFVKNPETQRLTHAIAVGTYKRFDPYALEADMPDLMICPSVLCVVDHSRPPEGLVTVFHDVELGADYLRWKCG